VFTHKSQFFPPVTLLSKQLIFFARKCVQIVLSTTRENLVAFIQLKTRVKCGAMITIFSVSYRLLLKEELRGSPALVSERPAIRFRCLEQESMDRMFVYLSVVMYAA
jgi:hypothetical protein